LAANFAIYGPPWAQMGLNRGPGRADESIDTQHDGFRADESTNLGSIKDVPNL
jgi:hypothetical protein